MCYKVERVVLGQRLYSGKQEVNSLNPIGENAEKLPPTSSEKSTSFILIFSAAQPLFSRTQLFPSTYKMKRRITFIQRPESPFVPEQVSISPAAVSVHGLDAAREDRITLSLDDLPDEVGYISHSRWHFPRTTYG